MEENVRETKNIKVIRILGAVLGNSALILVTTLAIALLFVVSVILLLKYIFLQIVTQNEKMCYDKGTM